MRYNNTHRKGRNPQSPCRPRVSNWPMLIGLLGLSPLTSWLWRRNVDLALATGQTPNTAMDLPPQESSIGSKNRPILCDELMNGAYENKSVANDTRLLLRYTNENPQFWISLHDKEFDPIRWGIMEHGTYYEKSQTDSFRTILQNSDRPRVIDVGGNIGWYTLLSASMEAMVDVFEPNKKNLYRICESLCLNGWNKCFSLGSLVSTRTTGKVRVFPFGIGSEESTVLFETSSQKRSNPGAGGIVAVKNVPRISKEKYTQIEIVPLDTLASAYGWFEESIDILKIDVEGYEIHVIRGATELLRRRVVRNIFMEGDVSGRAMLKKFREIVRTLVNAGYGVKGIGGFSGPTTIEVPRMNATIESELAAACAGNAQKRKKCNIWWALPQ